VDTVQLTIDGMSCAHCVARVTSTLSAVAGVTVEDVAIGSARVALDARQTSVGTLVEALADAGFEARVPATNG
jgi:copper chaperone CopZ